MTQRDVLFTDTHGRCVFARATSAGTGGISTLLLDGADALALLRPQIQSKRPLETVATPDPFFGRIADRAGIVVDEVILSVVDSKNSPTGNLQIELSCHGGAGALAAVEAVLLDAGFQCATGTELLERAHLNGKLSLIALEARVRLARAATARQADFLLSHETLQQKWERLGFEMALGLRESRTDWREPLLAAAEHALAQSRPACAILQQHPVVVTGPVNAGKSTLANLLARSERHIVSEMPGTTLDRLDVPVAIRGLNVLLSDTAGLRESEDELEREGQRRALQAAGSASLRLAVLDGSLAPGQAEIQFLQHCATHGALVVVLNKLDLGIHEKARGLKTILGVEPCAIAARDGQGLGELESAIELKLVGPSAPEAGAPFTQRQIQHIEQLYRGLKDSIDGAELVVFFRKLIGTRPDPEELRQAI